MAHPPLARFADWPERLSRFLDLTCDQPFAWGVNDCALRACSAVEAITGVDIADALRGRYHTELGAARTIRAFAGRTLEEVAMKIATDFAVPETSPLLARRGDVVLLDTPVGPALGIVNMTGHQAEFASPQGVVRWPLSACRRAWRIG